jgi:NH3-dependent NAD+ synthetase
VRQTDEDELGFSYHDADLVMVCIEALGMTPEQTAARTGVSADVVARVSARVAAVLWKHLVPHAL